MSAVQSTGGVLSALISSLMRVSRVSNFFGDQRDSEHRPIETRLRKDLEATANRDASTEPAFTASASKDSELERAVLKPVYLGSEILPMSASLASA